MEEQRAPPAPVRGGGGEGVGPTEGGLPWGIQRAGPVLSLEDDLEAAVPDRR